MDDNKNLFNDEKNNLKDENNFENKSNDNHEDQLNNNLNNKSNNSIPENLENINEEDKKQWFFLRCIGGQEHNFIKKLKNHSQFHTYFTDDFIILSEYEKKQKKSKASSIFSGYFLTRLSDQPLSRAILRTCGASIIRPYDEKDIQLLLDNITDQSNLVVNKNFHIKEEVKVNMGIINGEGTIISINEEKQMAMVELLCFNSYTSVNVPFENLEKIKK